MSNPERPNYGQLTEQHFLVFGRITWGYAVNEYLLKTLMAHILGAHVGVVVILTDRMNSNSLLQKMRAMNVQTPDDGVRAKVDGFLDVVEKVAMVRNAIAHSTWMPGTRPHSVRPVSIAMKRTGVQLRGYEDHEADHLLEDFESAFLELEQVSDGIVKLLTSLGYDPRNGNV